HLGLAQRLHLAADEHDPGLDGVDDVVVAPRLAVGRDDEGAGRAGGLGHGERVPTTGPVARASSPFPHPLASAPCWRWSARCGRRWWVTPTTACPTRRAGSSRRCRARAGSSGSTPPPTTPPRRRCTRSTPATTSGPTGTPSPAGSRSSG